MMRYEAELLEQETELQLGELCRICGVSREVIIEWVQEGVVEPRGEDPWRFPARHLGRIRRARRLQQDFELDSHALSVVLDLLEEVERLRNEVRVLRRLQD
jgi:chaperone modulatory protein CbpM